MFPSFDETHSTLNLNKTKFISLETTEPFDGFRPSIAMYLGESNDHLEAIYAFVSKKQVENITHPYERHYHLLRFTNGFKESQKFDETSNDDMI